MTKLLSKMNVGYRSENTRTSFVTKKRRNITLSNLQKTRQRPRTLKKDMCLIDESQRGLAGAQHHPCNRYSLAESTGTGEVGARGNSRAETSSFVIVDTSFPIVSAQSTAPPPTCANKAWAAKKDLVELEIRTCLNL